MPAVACCPPAPHSVPIAISDPALVHSAAQHQQHRQLPSVVASPQQWHGSTSSPEARPSPLVLSSASVTPSSVAATPSSMEFALEEDAFVTISEEQEQHIASLVRKTRRKVEAKRPLLPHHKLVLSCPSPGEHDHHYNNLLTTRGLGPITPASSSSSRPLSLTQSPNQSPSLAFGRPSPRNFNVFRLKLPSASSSSSSSASSASSGSMRLGFPVMTDEECLFIGGAMGADEMNEDDEEEETDDEEDCGGSTPGNAGLGMEDEYGEIVLMGIHDGSKNKASASRRSDSISSSSSSSSSGSEESEQDSSPIPALPPIDSALGLSARLGELSGGGVANVAFTESAPAPNVRMLDRTPSLTPDDEVSASAPPPAAGGLSGGVGGGLILVRCESALQATVAQPAPVIEPLVPSTLRKPMLARRATLSGGLDALKLRAAPYDFNAAGSLLIEGWEISKKGIVRTPPPTSAGAGPGGGGGRRGSLGLNDHLKATSSCYNSPHSRRKHSFGEMLNNLAAATASTDQLEGVSASSSSSVSSSVTNTPTLLGRRLSLVKSIRERSLPSSSLSSPSQSHRRRASCTGELSEDILASLTGLRDPAVSCLLTSSSSTYASPLLTPRLMPTLTDDALQDNFGPRFKLPRQAAGLGIELRLSDLVRLGEIGRGVNGAVHKALYLPTLTIVALKSVSIFDKDERNQFLSELRAFLNCASTNMVRFVGACFSEGKITMALEYLNRGSLDHVIQRSGPLTEPVLRLVAQQLLMGIRDLHAQNFLHRDIKPANFLIDNRGLAKVTDFGLLKQLVANEAGIIQHDSKFVGTMLYLAPERIAGAGFSFPSDVYAVGLSLILLATGELQSVPRDYWALVQAASAPSPTLPPQSEDGRRNVFSSALRDLVDRMLVKDPGSRLTASQCLDHPWFSTEGSSSPGDRDPLVDWPGRELLAPEPDELAILVDAVVNRWYPLKDSALSSSTTPFEPTRFDLARFEHLAQQLGWQEEPVIAAFVERLLERAQEASILVAQRAAVSAAAAAASAATVAAAANAVAVVDSLEMLADFQLSASPASSTSCSSSSPASLTPLSSSLTPLDGSSPLPRSLNSSPRVSLSHSYSRELGGSPRSRPPKAPQRPIDGVIENSSLLCHSERIVPRRLTASSRRATFNTRVGEPLGLGAVAATASSPHETATLLGILRKVVSANTATANEFAASAIDSGV